MRRLRLVVTAAGPLAAALVLGVAPPAAAAPHRPPPVPGAPGIGDPLFPDLGNGGYDVERYAIDMTYRGPHAVQAATTIVARAYQTLSRFDLDFDGNVIRSVTVDGRPARWSRSGPELIVTPRRVLRQGNRFSVRVTYSADPAGAHSCPTPPPLVGSAWFPTPDGGFVTAGQPNCMHTVFPSNDHPRDKATYRFSLTVPSAFTAVANGALARRAAHGATTTWTYREDEPMATELVQIAIGDYTVLKRRGPHGVLLRDVVPTDEAATIGPKLVATEDEELRWMESKVGRYPFEEYGVLAAKLQIGFALETQTLSLFPDYAWGPRSTPAGVEPVQVHELAHQWFGDDVSPEKWADVWLNEGHATWYEALYADEKGWASFEERMRAAYAAGDQWRRTWGPVASPPATDLFNNNVYDGGALVLYALRQKIGTAAFERLERAWVRRYSGGAAGTPDFIALASRVAGRDLSGFLTAWLYGTTTPPMPGHPDWTVDPVGAAAARTMATAAARTVATAAARTALARR